MAAWNNLVRPINIWLQYFIRNYINLISIFIQQWGKLLNTVLAYKRNTFAPHDQSQLLLDKIMMSLFLLLSLTASFALADPDADEDREMTGPKCGDPCKEDTDCKTPECSKCNMKCIDSECHPYKILWNCPATSLDWGRGRHGWYFVNWHLVMAMTTDNGHVNFHNCIDLNKV